MRGNAAKALTHLMFQIFNLILIAGEILKEGKGQLQWRIPGDVKEFDCQSLDLLS